MTPTGFKPLSCSGFRLTESDFKKALREIDTFMDIHVEDLVQIHEIACIYAQLRDIEHELIHEYMTQDVITISPYNSLARAANLFLNHGVSGLPVVDSNKKILGILTEADLLSAIGLSCKKPYCGLWHKLEKLLRHEIHIRNLLGRVGDLMYDKPVYIEENKTLRDAIQLMKKWHIKKLVVVDSAECISGILTRSNIIKALLEGGVMGSHNGLDSASS